MARSKFIVLSLTTLGLYPAYWAYRNWWWVKRTRDENVMPVLRAIFSPISMFFLLRHLESEARDEGIDTAWSPFLIALLFLALSASWRLPDPYWLISLLAFLALLGPVATANAIHSRATGKPPKATYSGFAIGIVIAGGIVLLLVLMATFFPEVAQEAASGVTA